MENLIENETASFSPCNFVAENNFFVADDTQYNLFYIATKTQQNKLHQ